MQAERKEAAFYAVAFFVVVSVPLLVAAVAASVH
jgi:hypothetical protein